MQLKGPDKKESRKSGCHKNMFLWQNKTKKMKVGATKIQPGGSDKKEIRKRGYH